MPEETPRDEAADAPSGTRSELSGFAGEVVQARDVSGGVHFHRVADADAGSVPRQLPGDVRGFIDRSGDLAALDLILAGDEENSTAAAVCVIVGTAGVGKTSLAVHWAHQVLDQFADGQLYVNLRGYDPGTPVPPDQALERFLRTLDVPALAIPNDIEARAALYRSRLAGKRMLIVLDNASSVSQVRPLLPGAPGCLVLVTSRSRLSGLVARDGAYRLTLAMLPEPDAIALIRRVAGTYRGPDDATELTELSRLCARLPLALRIAAERAAGRPTMPLRELIDDLRDESALWDALSASDDDESDAVRTVFAWSYRGLSADASRLFRLLGLHPGPEFSTRAAAVLADVPVGKTRRLLDELVGVHLLEQPSSGRYQFHDLLRAYAVDEIRHESDASVAGAALRRLLLWYLRTADAALAVMVPAARHLPLAERDSRQDSVVFSGLVDAVDWYEQERAPNLVAATRAADVAAMHDIAWQLPATLHRIYANRNQFDDWHITSTIGLGAVRQVGDSDGEALILESLAKLHTQSWQPDQAIDFHQSALAIRRDLGDLPGEVSSVNGVGLAMLRGHRLREAMTYFQQVADLALTLGDQAWRATAMNNLAQVFLELGQFDEARQRIHQALSLDRTLGDRGSQGEDLHCLSQIQRRAGAVAEANTAINEALDIAREHENRAWEAWWLVELGRVQLARQQPEIALEALHRAATLHRTLGDRSREAAAWDATGEAFLLLERSAEAIDFHRRALSVYRMLGDQWNSAVVLNNLAMAFSAAGTTSDAAQHWSDAEQILAEFTDPAAQELRQHVARSLRDATPPAEP